MKIDISVALSKALRNAPNPASFARGALTAAVVECAELVRENFAQLDMEREAAPDHTDFLAQPLLTKRPEQLSVQDFIDLTNRVEAHYAG